MLGSAHVRVTPVRMTVVKPDRKIPYELPYDTQFPRNILIKGLNHFHRRYGFQSQLSPSNPAHIRTRTSTKASFPSPFPVSTSMRRIWTNRKNMVVCLVVSSHRHRPLSRRSLYSPSNLRVPSTRGLRHNSFLVKAVDRDDDKPFRRRGDWNGDPLDESLFDIGPAPILPPDVARKSRVFERYSAELDELTVAERAKARASGKIGWDLRGWLLFGKNDNSEPLPDMKRIDSPEQHHEYDGVVVEGRDRPLPSPKTRRLRPTPLTSRGLSQWFGLNDSSDLKKEQRLQPPRDWEYEERRLPRPVAQPGPNAGQKGWGDTGWKNDERDKGLRPPQPNFIQSWWANPRNRTARFFLRLIFAIVLVPYMFTTFCRLTIINPVLEARLESNAEWFAITEEQEQEVAVKVERVRQRMEYAALMGRAPPLSGERFLESLREEGEKLEAEERVNNKKALANVLSDSLSALLLGVAVFTNKRRVQLLQGWLGEKFLNMEASTQAFSLLLAADVLVGYHSSDGWITAVNLVLAHYGLPENEELTSLFVATVPVALDVTFKYWAFKTLRKIAPSTQIILNEIEN
mmetsp:Transcript_5228/g.9949  ORF Transcript_5228/g.9949 Transcript_5228/m.9949 type:complete len:573 (+) Transcript_5228:410-2128(+)|eukprot:CAMPEP_0114235690 /NCGR_PEP_ID=MMETSP0058-20121206/6391_1 /TAXON_ID=36894 /ORGANISM="Pyramimonas parkeae, CCMP726" /LENGTH=572 /DNA_ID=CAMNT_0001347481 /DNA_START=326 /DNA_END=2044 /DNA_ORIENTATION=+